MRVLVIHSRYTSGSVSGENRVVDDEVHLLRRGGHEVVSWSPTLDAHTALTVLRAGGATIWSRDAAARVRHLVDQHRPDVVHIHNLFPALSPAAIRAVEDRSATVMTLHNYRLSCLPGTLLRQGELCEDCVGRLPWRGIVHRCYRGSAAASGALAASIGLHRAIGSFARVHRFLAVSQFVKAKHVEGGLPVERIRVRSNFAWPTTRRHGSGRYFLYLGRLSAEKGVSMLLAACGKTGAPLKIIGDGPDAAMLRAAAGPSVHLDGSVPASMVPALLSGARALLVPSRWFEGAPRVILEAYAAGVPVVASCLGGLPELVEHDQSGLLVPPDEPAAWMRAIRQLSDDEEAARLGEGAVRRWRASYTPAHGLASLERAYEDAVRAHRSSSAAAPEHREGPGK